MKPQISCSIFVKNFWPLVSNPNDCGIDFELKRDIVDACFKISICEYLICDFEAVGIATM